MAMVDDTPMPAPVSSLGDLLPVEVFHWGKQALVGGLLWEKLPTAHGYKDTVRANGAKQGLDTAVVVKTGLVMQVGYGVAAKGAVPGAASLARVVAGLLGDDFIGIFELGPERYALVAVVGGAVVPGADRIGDAVLMREEFATFTAQYAASGQPFSTIYAPQGFLDVPAEEVDLLHRLNAKAIKRSDRLIRIGGTPAGASRWRLPVMALVVLALAGGVGFYWKVQRDRAAAAAAAAAEAARQAHAKQVADAQAAAARAAVVPPKPWVSQPSVADFVASCSTQLAKLPLSLAGWPLDHATCQVASLSATYIRQPNATIEQLSQAMLATLGVAPDIRNGGNEAGLNVGFPPPPSASEDLIDPTLAQMALISHFQALTVPVTVTLVAPPTPPANGKTPPPPPPPWVTYHVVITDTPVTAMTTTHHPSLLLAGLDIPGLRLTKILLTRKDDKPFIQWSVEGDLYVRR